MFPGQVNRYHWGFDDPAHAKGSEEEVYAEFRRVRDQISWSSRLMPQVCVKARAGTPPVEPPASVS